MLRKLSLLSIMIIATLSLAVVKSSTKLFPVLPQNCSIVGGSISIKAESMEGGNGNYNTAGSDYLSQGLVFSSDLNSYTQNLYPIEFGNRQTPFGDKYGDFRRIDGLDYFSNRPSIAIQSDTPVAIVGPGSFYYPKSNILVMSAIDSPRVDMVMENKIIDTVTMRKLMSYNSNLHFLPITKDIAQILNQLVNIRTGEIYSEEMFTGNTTNPISNGRYVMTTKGIYDTNTHRTIALFDDMGVKEFPWKFKSFGFEFYTVVKDDEPQKTQSIFRFDFSGNLIEKRDLNLAKPFLYTQILDSYKSLALVIHKSLYKWIYRIIEMNTGLILFEQPVKTSYLDENQFEFINNKGIYKDEEGCKIFNLDTMKLEKAISFPLKPKLIKKGEKICLVKPDISSETEQDVAYLLDDNLKPDELTRTILPYNADLYALEEDEIIAVKSTPTDDDPKNKYIFYLNLTISHHTIGSSKPYDIVKCQVGSFVSKIDQSCYYGGKLYIPNHFNRIVVIDSSTGFFSEGIYVNKEPKLFNENKYDNVASVVINDDKIITILSDDKKDYVLTCFDIDKSEILARFSQDENYKIYHLSKKCLIYNSQGLKLLRFGDELKTIRGKFLTYSDPYIFYETNQDIKGKTIYTLNRLDIDTGQITAIPYNTRFSVQILKLAGAYMDWNGNIIDDEGTFIQRDMNQLTFYEQNLSINTEEQPTLGNVNGNIIKLKPCPTVSVKHLAIKNNEITFSFTNTRQDDLDLVLKSEVYLASWGDDGKPPIFTKLDEPHHKLGPLLPGMSQEITFDLPKPQEIDGKKSEGKYFALIVESNGLLDTKNSELSDFDKEGRPLFDGIPLSLDKQHAIVLTVWKR